MADLSKIEYEEKSNVNAVVSRPQQATAEDFNEIKGIVNAVVDAVNGMKCDEVAVTSGENNIVFNSPYPAGFEFVILFINVTDATGLHVGWGITNKSESGFTATVTRDGKLFYLTMPRR